MAGYTSRILLTFTIPFFGFVLWFLKKKKSSKSISNKSIQVEDCISSTLFEKQNFEFDSTSHQNKKSSCEDKSTMQLKETQTPESQSTSVTQQNGISQDSVQQNGLSEDCVQQHSSEPEVNGQHNSISNNVISHNISQESVQNNNLENNVEANGVSSNNYIQQNGVSQKNVLPNGTQQNGISKGKKKKKSKVHEKSNTCPTDIVGSNERLHLEDETEFIKRVEAIDLKSVSAKDEFLNAINKNEMNKMNGTHCDSQSSTCINGNTNHETNLSTVENEESAKDCGDNVQMPDERNSNETQLVQTEIGTDPCRSLILPVDCANVLQTNGEMMGSPGTSYCDSLGSFSFVSDRLILG